MTPVLQSEAAECALACLTMIARAHGQATELRELRQRFPLSLKGATLEILIKYSSELGFSARPLRLELDEIGELSFPCILHWDLNHFVVIEKVRRGYAIILDPAVGRRKMRLSDFSRHFTGIALELTPIIGFREKTEVKGVNLKQLTGKITGIWRALIQIFILAALLEIFSVTAPLLNQLIVDHVISSGDLELLNIVVMGFILLLFVQTTISVIRSWMVMILGQDLGIQWYGNVFFHMIKLPVEYFEKRHLGDITSRFSSVASIQRTLTTSVIEAVLDGIMAVVAFLMMLLYIPILTVPVLIATLLYVGLRYFSYETYRNAAAERMVLAAKENSHFLETIRAIVPLKLFGREDERKARWQNLIVEVQNRDIATAKLNVWFSCFNSLLFGTENLAVFWIGARLVIGGQTGSSAGITIGMLFAFISFKTQFTSRIGALINYAVEIRMLRLHTERLADIVLTMREPDSPMEHMLSEQLDSLPPSIELKNISFHYAPGEPWILDNVTLKIEAGDNIAITGPSGSGKSTLLKIALGLLEPTSGEVLYGGRPIHKLGLANVRRIIGTVMQEDVLLSGSISENIAFFDTLANQDRVRACANISCIHNEITAMPMGYQTLVGDLGSGLSGGQKQRILLARAMYKRPKILALDEATSHLDIDNEIMITETLRGLRLTKLVIAHRAETIAGAKRVVWVNQGSVVERTDIIESRKRS